MAFGSKKETQIYFSFLSKVPANEPLHKKETRLQGILHISRKPHLSGSPVKGPSLKVPLKEHLTERCPNTRALLHSSIKVLGIRAPSHTGFPPATKRPPQREMPASGDLLDISSRVPSEEAPPSPLPHRASSERQTLHPPSPLHPSLKVPSSRFPKKGPLWKEMIVSRAFSTYLSGSPARELSLQVPFTDLPQREKLHP
jgi:hypothetical protein